MIDKINCLVEENHRTLKDFQEATVNYVIRQFYEKHKKKILVADEVGLGKTMVAKGVVLRSLQRYASKGEPFHVVYICSNQVLAQQNMSTLNVFGDKNDTFSRLTYLALKREPGPNMLRLSSLTPSTSFKLTRSVGDKKERAILLALLCSYEHFNNNRVVLIKIFRGKKHVGLAGWNNLALDFIEHRENKLRPGAAKKFKAHLLTTICSAKHFPLITTYIGLKGETNIWRALERLVGRLENDGTKDPLDFANELIRALRFELTNICTEFLDANLFILDEFQRFKELLNHDDQTEAAKIARKVLADENTMALLLSATPFKSFTTKLEELANENHFDEFRKLVLFLGGTKGNSLWSTIKQDQEAFFEMLRFPRQAIEEMTTAIDIKNRLQAGLKQIMSRNERMSVAKGLENMVISAGIGFLPIIREDIENFIAIDQVTEELKKLAVRKRFSGSTMEFAKSTPYPLSFLRAYKLRETIDLFKDNKTVKSLLKKKGTFIDFGKIDRYEPLSTDDGKPSFPNGKLRALTAECFDNNGHALLWVPPSKPYYKPFGAYAKSERFSKVLVFSGWKMVPRAVSALLSYESERRVVRQELPGKKINKQKKKYFTEHGKRQRALLVFNSGDGKFHMTNVCLTYPCSWLVKFLESQVFFNKDGQRYAVVKKSLSIKLETAVRKLNLEEKYANLSTVDVKWYWVLPALLDRLNGEGYILQDILSKEVGAKQQHYLFLQRYLTEIIKETHDDLGIFPSGLFDTLAEIALCSPANVALRAFGIYFKDEIRERCNRAYDVADAFVGLFNKPESIAIVKNNGLGLTYWRQVLNYCASGNLAGMLEEFVYLLKSHEGTKTMDKATIAIVDVLSVRNSSIQVDDSNTFYQGKSREMRCHFAVSYGDQKIGTDAGDNRMISIREVFNSPFRPFVLTSTSIGQEGLDFHYYCRKIFHWNLPHNPIDIEQREGRINRYKALAIRQSLAEKLSLNDLASRGGALWDAIFELAVERMKSPGDSDLVPFWYLNDGKYKIERFVPIHQLSRDVAKYDAAKETLALYRLTFGQPRQEELVEAFRNAELTEEEIIEIRKSLLIDLSPMIT